MTKRIVSLVSIIILSIGSFFVFLSPKKNEVAYADTYNVLPDIMVTATNRAFGALYMPIPVKFSPNNLSDFTRGYYSFSGWAYGSIRSSNFSGTFSFVYDDWIYSSFSDIDDNYFSAQIYCDSGFAFNNITNIEFYGYAPADGYSRNVIRFSDADSHIFRVDFWSFFVSNNTIVPGLLYQSTPLVLYTAPVDSTTTTWQEGYQNGYGNGLISGQSIGYTDGYNVGYSAGDAVGYQRGVDASNQYSFGNLLFSVVDTPVVIFRSLFDFTVLGVNLQSFFLSLLTVAVVIAVVRFILAR